MTRTLLMVSLLVAAVGCYSEDPQPNYGGGGYGAPGYGPQQGAPGAAPGAYDNSGGAPGSPDLVAVDGSPGVQVIADYDYPVFYSDNFYWRYDGGLWYRSGYWGGGWGVSYNVPYGIRGIAHPYSYAHYRPAGWVARGGVGFRGGAGYRGGAAYRGGGGYRAPARGGVQAVHGPSYRPASGHSTSHASGGHRR